MKIFINILVLSFLCFNSAFSQKYLKIVGIKNENIESVDILKYEKKYSDSISVISNLINLRNELYNIGFISASIDTIYSIKDTIYSNIYLGKKFRWGKINFDSVDSTVLKKLKVHQSNYKNKIVKLNDYNILAEKIVNYYESIGFPFVLCSLSNVDFNDSIISADCNVSKNQKYYIKSIILKGNAKITLPYLYNYLDISPKSVYNGLKVNLISKRIKKASFIKEIKPAELEYSDSTIDIYLYLENEKANSFNGVLGFMPESGDDSKLNISGDIDFSIWNIWGRGEHLLFNWKRPSDLTQKLNLDFSFPYLFYTKIASEVSFSLYKKDTNFLNIESDIGFRYDFAGNQYIKGYCEYKISNSINDIDFSNNNQINNNADVSSVLYGVNYRFSNLDYKQNPGKGLVFETFGVFGNKKIEQLQVSDSVSLKDIKTVQIETGLSSKYYIPIHKKFVFLIGVELRFMTSINNDFGKDLLFENELFRFGGARSLRGFNEDDIYASFYTINNFELRYRFEQNSAVYIFWNGAYYNKNTYNSNISDYPYGFGVGVDLEMKAGIFSLGYALGKQFNNPIELKSAKIYFAYITKF